MALHITGDADADALLDRDPLALLLAMLLDQQIPMEKAFTGPAVLARRLGTDPLDPAAIAGMDPVAFAAVMAGPPAVHRYHTSMAGRVQALAAHVVQRYGGDARAVWVGADTGAELLARLMALPGYGNQKARIFTALLGKQCGVRPPGWEQAAGDYALPGHRSVADVVDADSLIKVREVKRAAKVAARGARA
jgi:uncharacterized HhH-GPD family protein